MDTVKILARIDKEDIVYLNSLVEAYEGMAVMRTVDAVQGIVELNVSPFFLGEMHSLLEALSLELPLAVLKVERA